MRRGLAEVDLMRDEGERDDGIVGERLPRNCSRICWMSGVAPAILGGWSSDLFLGPDPCRFLFVIGNERLRVNLSVKLQKTVNCLRVFCGGGRGPRRNGAG